MVFSLRFFVLRSGPDAAVRRRFSDADNEQMNVLAARADKAGGLDPQEESLLSAYLLVGSLVDLMHSKSRLSLAKNLPEQRR